MTKIVLHKDLSAYCYRAVFGDYGIGYGIGRAYPIRRYIENDIEVLEAMVDNPGENRADAYHFSFDGSNWVTNSDPITPDWRARLWNLI